MASKAAKSAKRKGGRAQTGPAFAQMPGNSLASAEDAVDSLRFAPKRVSPTRAARIHNQSGRWLAPGEAVMVDGRLLPGGMIYFGASMPDVDGHGTEPSLVNPNLKTTSPRYDYFPETTSLDYPDYRNFTPLERWGYLDWLATGRSDPGVGGAYVYLFVYGIERRLLASFIGKDERPPSANEVIALRRELIRLTQFYTDARFHLAVRELLELLDVVALLRNPDPNALADPAALAALPRQTGGLPTPLALSLGRIAASQEPLSAEWAWAWFRHDPESPLRPPAVRCPDEMRRLFALRFAAAVGSEGIRLQPGRTPILLDYDALNPGITQRIAFFRDTRSRLNPALRHVSRTPLTRIRTIANGCMDELDAFSRRIAREPGSRHAIATVALLPDALFAKEPATRRFYEYLAALCPPDVPAATFPARDLLNAWQARDVDAIGKPTKSEPASMTRGETIALLQTLDLLGFAIEPDLRFGSPPLAPGKDGETVVAIARRTGDSGPIRHVFITVGVPLLVRAARAAGMTTVTPELMALARDLPYSETCNPEQFATRLYYLMANPKESGRLPKRQEPTLTLLTAGDKTEIADVLVQSASLPGSVGPAAVAELIKLFALLGLSESDLYSRLHAVGTTDGAATTQRQPRAAHAEPLLPPTKAAGRKKTGRQIPEASSPTTVFPIPPETAAKSDAVTIDLELVRRKVAESAQISSLLAGIFTEEEPTPATGAANEPAEATSEPLPPGALDERHLTLLVALMPRESWPKDEWTALARASNLLPNAALETINEAAYERIGEAVLEGEDPLYVLQDIAQEMLS